MKIENPGEGKLLPIGSGNNQMEYILKQLEKDKKKLQNKLKTSMKQKNDKEVEIKIWIINNQVAT